MDIVLCLGRAAILSLDPTGSVRAASGRMSPCCDAGLGGWVSARSSPAVVGCGAIVFTLESSSSYVEVGASAVTQAPRLVLRADVELVPKGCNCCCDCAAFGRVPSRYSCFLIHPAFLILREAPKFRS